MTLEKYKKKRHFSKTPEPEGEIQSSDGGNMFVVQKHAARRLHYDFRLELGGVLLSWAVPKGPSYDPAEKRLAVQVEDHPLEYGGFEGIIPKGEYGGGTVMVWDKGTWDPIGDPQNDYKRGHLKFVLHGQKLKGAWALIRMHADDEKNWLLVKEKDDEATPLSEYDVEEEEKESVLTGRSMDEIAQEQDRVWTSEGEQTPEQKPEAAQAELHPEQLPGATEAPQPEFISPQLASLVKDVPQGDQWLHEIKYDGYRIVCVINEGRARLFTRRANDWTDKFLSIQRAAEKLNLDKAILDGELVVLRKDGTTDFQALQNYIEHGDKAPLVYYVFDLPWFDGYDLTRVPLIQRKELLYSIIGPHLTKTSPLRYSDHIRGQGEIVFENVCRYAMEGLVCKRADSTYEQKRSRHWAKVKCTKRQEFIVAGYTDPGGARSHFGALVLGVHDSGKLVYCGRVGTGFNEKTLKSIFADLTARRQPRTPLDVPPPPQEARGVNWVKPDMVAEVEFTGWTGDGYLRHPSFKGIRLDKSPDEIVKEEPVPIEEVQPITKRTKASSAETLRIAGVALSNPDRVLYPEQGTTKQALAEFYETIADWILPHIVRRPVMLVRCPQGRHKTCFYQKHINETLPDPIRGIEVQEKDELVTYIAIENLQGLIALVQFGALELHPWGCTEKKIDQPDRITFDLDPGQNVTWDALVEAAHLVRNRLQELGLQSFVKTTGGKGLHVVAPLTPKDGWDEVKAFTKAVAESIVSDDPSRYIATMSKARRTGKIFVDYLRNGRGATAVAAYSTRARHGAPVSTPLRWEELTPDIRPDFYTIENLPMRLENLQQDPWEGFFKIRQTIRATAKKKLNL